METKFVYDSASSDSTYGFSEKNAINTAFYKDTTSLMGPFTERFYLDHLTMADGRRIRYSRSGSCCHTKSTRGTFGPEVPLDIYEIEVEGSDEKFKLYVNMYDDGLVYAPKGFKLNMLLTE